MRAQILRALVLALCAAASGSGATANQSKGLTGGVSETALSPDTFKITFSGNGYTSAERASDSAILRAAEKSLEMGCNYFVVRSEANGAPVDSVSVGSAAWSGHNAWASSATVPIVAPNSALFVKCYKQSVVGANLFDAHFVAQSIRSRYKFKPDVSAPAPSVAAASNSAQPVPALAPGVLATDVASMVLAAQRVATQQGSGDVHSAGGAAFQARCINYTVVFDCAYGSRHPVRTIRN